MPEHILFLTGKLAEKSLRKVLKSMEPTEFRYSVHQMGINVAALMTTDMIQRRLNDSYGADRILIPGRCRGDIGALSQALGILVERGPEELKDLPGYFGEEARQVELDRYDVQIFAEIVDAPNMSIEAIVEQAQHYGEQGADVIDLGCLPDTPFPHLQEAVQALKGAGFRVSVDSMVTDELLRGGKGGADYMLSLKEDTLWVADNVESTPVLIPAASNNMNSLYRAIEAMEKNSKRYIADPILDPIHAGFAASIVRYCTLRQHFPNTEIMMGVGNLTELTHADTAGINALLLGIMSELRITHMLTTQVSNHCRKAVREADLARRIMFVAGEDNTPPQHINEGLMALHERKPFPYALDEIKEFAAGIKDPNYRIQISEQGIHLYNRDGLYTAQDPFDLYPYLRVEDDSGHAFYLGVELARAQIAWQLGKRHDQDEELTWGCAVEKEPEDLTKFKAAGPTLHDKRRRAARKKRSKR